MLGERLACQQREAGEAPALQSGPIHEPLRPSSPWVNLKTPSRAASSLLHLRGFKPMNFSPFRHLALALCAAFLVSGCAIFPPPKKPAPPAAPVKPTPPPTSFWNGEGATGDPAITIDLAAQRAYFYKGDKVVGESRISSGRKGFETPPGEYKVIQKDKNHESNLYGSYVDAEGNTVKSNVDVNKDPAPEGATFKGAKMSYFLRFQGGYGMHAGILPGHRASHGCVRLPRTMAAHFFNAAPVGTPVTVRD